MPSSYYSRSIDNIKSYYNIINYAYKDKDKDIKVNDY